MITVEVVAKLVRPAVIDGPLHLDALLSARHPAMHGGVETLTRRGGAVRIAPLPLAVARSDQSWVWCASAWVPQQADGHAAIVKRRDGVDYRMTARPVYPAVGPDRDRLVRFATIAGPLRFLASVPDQSGAKELRRLLRRIDQIGGLRKSGYGVVGAWEVEDSDLPPQRCLLSEAGEAARTLPASMLVSASPPEEMAVLPPYWQSSETTKAHPCGTRGSLCDSLRITAAR